MAYWKVVILPLFILFTVVVSVHGGYIAGSSADTTTELNESIQEMEGNYSEARSNLTMNYSDTGGATEGISSTYDKTVYYGMVKPTYWFGKNLLLLSEVIYEGTARFSYRHL